MSVENKICPICGVSSNYVYNIHDNTKNDDSLWYRCDCGVIYQSELPSHSEYKDEYLDTYIHGKNVKEVSIHAAKCYSPLIEELTYGRKLLDIGFNLPYNINYFRDRGWIVTGLDINEVFKDHKGVIIGNFEDCDSLPDTYDVVWLSHVFEHFNNPLKALDKINDITSPDAVIYIAVPDIDFITKTGLAAWGHFKKREHYVLWSERALVRELERRGWHIVMKRRNCASRFSSWYDVQIIAQKNYF